MKNVIFFTLFGLLFMVNYGAAQKPPCTDQSEHYQLFREYKGYTFTLDIATESAADATSLHDSIRQGYAALYNFCYQHDYEWVQENCGKKENKDLLNNLISQYYKVSDYNPYLFFSQNEYSRNLYAEGMLKSALNIFFVQGNLNNFFKQSGADSTLMMDLMHTSYAYRLKIISNSCRVSNEMWSGVVEPRATISVLAKIEEIIKGQSYPALKDTTIPNSANEYNDPLPRNRFINPGDTIQFLYYAFPEETCDKANLSTIEDHEYIIFLFNGYICFPDTIVDKSQINKMYFTISPYNNLNFIDVTDGVVRDTNNYYGLGVENTVEEWLGKVGKVADKLRSGNVVGVEENIDDSPIKITELGSTINIETPVENVKTLKVYSLTGELIYEDSFNGRFEQISKKNFPSGLYFVFVQSGGKAYHAKFITN